MATSPLAETSIKNKLIAQLLQQGSDTSPISSHFQGLNRVAQSLLGGYGMREQDREAKEAPAEILKMWQASQQQPQHPLGPVTSGPRPPGAPPAFAPPAQDIEAPRVAGAFSAFPGTPQTPAAVPLQTGGSASDPRGIRNNNPLNIEAGQFTQRQPGFAGSDGRFARFEQPQQGIDAASNLLASYGQRGINTVAGVINRWAPPSDGNPVSAYAGHVARKLGVGPNDPIDLSNPQVRQQLVMAMGEFENGRPIQVAQAGGAPVAMPQGGAPMAPPQGTQQPQMGQPPGQPNVALIQQMINHPNARVRAYGTQLLQQAMTPAEMKSVVIGDKGFVFNPRTGQYTAGPDATKATNEERALASENRSRAQRGQQPLSITEFQQTWKAAEKAGTEEGEARAALESISSKMPGLESVVKQLDVLSNAATFTWAGRATDAVRRQLEMEPRNSAVARQQYISMVDNQILPLLRDTFGAQFTQREGESLRSTLGNPDLHPREKQAVLRAFIEQKRRDVEALARRTGGASSQPAAGAAPEATRSIGGKTYVKINGQWFEQ